MNTAFYEQLGYEIRGEPMAGDTLWKKIYKPLKQENRKNDHF